MEPNSIECEVSGTSSYSYPIIEKREYTGLNRNDPSLIEKSINKNGATLTLSDISWVPMGSTISGESIVSTYKAVATYSGTGYGSKADGYIVTAEYRGTVTKEVSGDYIYSIIYAPVEEKNGGFFGLGGGSSTQPNSGNNAVSGGSGESSITLGDNNGSFLSSLKKVAIFAGITILIVLFLTGVYLLIMKIKLQNNEKPEREKPNKKGFTAFWKTERNNRKIPPETPDNLSRYDGDSEEESYSKFERSDEEYEDTDEVAINSMDFYEEPGADVLQVTVDDDPDLSAMFQNRGTAEEGYYESEKEPTDYILQ